MAAAFKHTVDSAIRGFHVYKSTWTPVLNEELKTRQEPGNLEDSFAVYVYKEGTLTPTVDHVPTDSAGTSCSTMGKYFARCSWPRHVRSN